MRIASFLALSTSAIICSSSVSAQDLAPSNAQAATEFLETVTLSQAEPELLVIPPLIPIKIEIMADLGSKTSLSFDTFPIRLAEPVMIDRKVAIPAGAKGMGEVVHAKKSGGMGAAGELVLAARYLEVGSKRLRLISMRFASAGDSAINTVNTINIASAASPLPLSVIGFFINGGQVSVPSGTLANAMTAEEFQIEPHGSIDPVAADIAEFTIKESQ